MAMYGYNNHKYGTNYQSQIKQSMSKKMSVQVDNILHVPIQKTAPLSPIRMTEGKLESNYPSTAK